ncbi:DUF1642 domain-containing protein [Lactococcus lactis subsp. cremoris]|nr:DUF1642 domain-containing protein [Lactococcus cremoris]MRM77589.1 DUF1642 domain-containing protein [Lactococcus cremoris]
MYKTFKQKLEILPIKNIEHPVGNTKYYAAVHVKSLISQADEEFQELLDKYSNLNVNYEKEVIRSSKLESQIISLKSQLKQQALPAVPSFIGEWLDSNNLAGLLDEWYCHHEDMSSHIREYFERLPYKGPNNLSEMENNIVTFITQAKLDGYTVEKPQLFYLKNKLTGMWLMRDEVDEVYPYDHTLDIRNIDKFTQSEIDSMETGSYELVPVEDGE